MRRILIVPGIHDSGPDHWQSRWQALHPNVGRVVQRDWTRPVRTEWVQALDEAVRCEPEPPIVVAHSLGCLAVSHWVAGATRPLHAVLMVAVPDPTGPNFPREATGFAPLPDRWKGPRLTIVSSDDDPYASPSFTLRLVRAWQAEHVSAGAVGHINAASGLGIWDEGWQLACRFMA